MSQKEVTQVSTEGDDERSKFNMWIFESIRPYITGRTFEINSGTGLISSILAQQGYRLHLSDSFKKHRDILREKFLGVENVRTVQNIDFLDPVFGKTYSKILASYDTVLAINIAEHGYYEDTAIENAKLLVRRGGHLIIAMTAFTALFDGTDLSLDEWRNYNRKSLKRFFVGFDILKSSYFSFENNKSHTSDISILVVALRI